MREQPVTIARFGTSIEAERAGALLEEAGISVELARDAYGGTSPIDLRVSGDQADAARNLLDGPVRADPQRAPRDPAAVESERCLICRSTALHANQAPLLLRILRGLVLQVLPLPAEWFESGRRSCEVCGHEWRRDTTTNW